MGGFSTGVMILVFFVLFLLFNWIKVLREYERGVIFRLGRVLGKPKGPGLILVLYPIDKIERISLRTIVLDVPPQDIITKDNVTVKVNAVLYFDGSEKSRNRSQGFPVCHFAAFPNHLAVGAGPGGPG